MNKLTLLFLCLLTVAPWNTALGEKLPLRVVYFGGIDGKIEPCPT